MVLSLLLASLVYLTPNPDYFQHYKADVVSAYDGDTITVRMHLGLGVIMEPVKIRLYGINAPEMRGPEKAQGKVSRDNIRQMIYDHEVIIETIKDKRGKYGRLLGIVWVKGQGSWCPVDAWCNVNDALVKNGFAVYKVY